MPRLASAVLADIQALVTELNTAIPTSGDCSTLVDLIAAMQSVYRDKCNGGV